MPLVGSQLRGHGFGTSFGGGSPRRRRRRHHLAARHRDDRRTGRSCTQKCSVPCSRGHSMRTRQLESPPLGVRSPRARRSRPRLPLFDDDRGRNEAGPGLRDGRCGSWRSSRAGSPRISAFRVGAPRRHRRGLYWGQVLGTGSGSSGAAQGSSSMSCGRHRNPPMLGKRYLKRHPPLTPP